MTQPRTRDGRYTYDAGQTDDRDLEPDPIDQDGERMGAVGRLEEAAANGDRQTADRIAEALGTVPQSKLGDIHGQGTLAVWDGRRVFPVEVHGRRIEKLDRELTPEDLPKLTAGRLGVIRGM